MMNELKPCPYCKARAVRTLDCRKSYNASRRRKVCESCGKRYTTYEVDAEFFNSAIKNQQILSTIKSVLINETLDESLAAPKTTCDLCANWEKESCAFDFPEAGGQFASECSMFIQNKS